MQLFKNNLLYQFSLSSLVIMLILAITLSLILKNGLRDKVALLEAHQLAMSDMMLAMQDHGKHIAVDEPFSIPNLKKSIVDLQTLSYLSVVIAFVVLYLSLLSIVWRGWKTITKQKEQLELAKSQAQKSNQTKNIFLANMSHELRTPLNAIIGYTEMLQEEEIATSNTSLAKDLGKIHSAGTHLFFVIGNILDISKIESGQINLFLEWINVLELVNDLVVMHQSHIEKNTNTISVICPANIGKIYTDETKLKQALANLISNAAKFTQCGKLEIVVTRTMHASKDLINFTVTDTGIGIPDDYLKRLFKPFSQMDMSFTRKYGGTGLGLAISSKFCEHMGGSLSVKSQLGKGSSFTITLPVMVVVSSHEQLTASKAVDITNAEIVKYTQIR